MLDLSCGNTVSLDVHLACLPPQFGSVSLHCPCGRSNKNQFLKASCPYMCVSSYFCPSGKPLPMWAKGIHLEIYKGIYMHPHLGCRLLSLETKCDHPRGRCEHKGPSPRVCTVGFRSLVCFCALVCVCVCVCAISIEQCLVASFQYYWILSFTTRVVCLRICHGEESNPRSLGSNPPKDHLFVL